MYEGRIQSSQLDCDAVVTTQIEGSSDVGSQLTTSELEVQQVLLGTPYDDNDDGDGGVHVVTSVATLEVVILDPKEASPAHKLARARYQSYEHNKQWQDT